MKNERRKYRKYGVILIFAVAILFLFCSIISAQAADMGVIYSGETRSGSITITIGEDKEVIITEFNYHNSWFEDDPNNPEPWPDQREAYSEGNIAYVSLSATPGHAGVARSRI